MEGKKWIYFFVFLTTLLQFIARADGTKDLHVTVRAGDDATLTCKNVLKDQPNCSSTTWNVDRESQTEELVAYGRIRPGSKSDRLAVREDCSLVIKKVTYEDVGRYTCQQFISEKKHDNNAYVYLSVLTMAETHSPKGLRCHVRSRHCPHRVTWLHDAVDQRTSQTGCYTDLNLQPRYNTSLLECKVTVGKQSQLFPFRPPSSGNKPEKGKRGQKSTTTKGPTTQSTKKNTSPEKKKKPTSGNELRGRALPPWLWLVIVLAGVALITLLIVIEKFIQWKRTEGNRAEMPDNAADPEDGVTYASVSYTRKNKSKNGAQGKDDDDNETVTYATVKTTPSSSTAAVKVPADPSAVYATVNRSQS